MCRLSIVAALLSLINVRSPQASLDDSRPDMDAATRADLAEYVGCVAGALTREEFARQLADAGLTDIEITETHRVHPHAGSAIVRARKPGA